MAKASALVLTGFGINCDYETQYAFHLAGAKGDRVHLNDLIADKSMLDRYNILAIPGGFSFGDDIASGKVLANRMRYALGDELRKFVDDGKLVIGICNGFQVLTKMGLLPGLDGDRKQQVTVAFNDSGKFEDRWVTLKHDRKSKCVFTEGLDTIELPVRHGEGKFIPKDKATLNKLRKQGCVVLRYIGPNGDAATYPHNPNGSIDDIAGICDTTGRIFGLMPHPEAFLVRTNHPRWTRTTLPEEGAGRIFFDNAVKHIKANL
jgi:phosphoribosylformylglycinamidine synthase I